MQVANCTTPAQYFHLLRRQMHGGADRRGPQAAGRDDAQEPAAASEGGLDGGRLDQRPFRRCWTTTASRASRAYRRVLLCTGKIYYDLLAAREHARHRASRSCAWSSCIRSPKPSSPTCLRRYPQRADVVWVQEEPRNMGAWCFVRGRIQPMLGPHQAIGYAGRPRAPVRRRDRPKRHAARTGAIDRGGLRCADASRVLVASALDRRQERTLEPACSRASFAVVIAWPKWRCVCSATCTSRPSTVDGRRFFPI